MPVNCCKKWVGDELKKFYSPNPCSSSGAVPCSETDPQKPSGVQISSTTGAQAGIAASAPGVDGDTRCQSGFHWDNTENRCVPDAGPPGHGCYPGFDWDEDQQRCVPRIPECPEPGTHWDKLKKRCVPDEGCPQGFHPDVDGECVPDDEPPDKRCDHLGPNFIWSDKENRCIPDTDPRCDDGFHWDNDRKICVPDNGDGENPCETGGYELTKESGFAGGAGQGRESWAEVPGTERSADWEGHMVWNPSKGAFVNTGDPEGQTYDLVCKKGWVRKPDAEGNTWCCPEGGPGPGPGPDGPGGEFKWGEDLQGLLARIMERANYLLDYPRGLTPQERQGVINYAIEGVKSGERGQLQSSRDLLARRGLLGSGFEFEEAGRIRRETRGRETQVRREFGIDELDRRFQELMGTTGMAQGLTGTLMQGEQIPEILSGARRAEGQAAVNSFLAFLSGSMGGQGNQYQAAIINQLMGGQGGSGIMDWLPWILAGQGGR